MSRVLRCMKQHEDLISRQLQGLLEKSFKQTQDGYSSPIRRSLDTYLRSDKRRNFTHFNKNNGIIKQKNIFGVYLSLLSSTFGLKSCNDISLCQNEFYNRPMNDDEDDDADSVILCYSISASSVNQESPFTLWLRSLIEWINNLLKQCYTVALLTIRGSEIMLRMSPFVVLTPASIIAAKIISAADDARSGYNVEVDEEHAPIKSLLTKVQLKKSSATNRNYKQFNKINNSISDWTWDYFIYTMNTLGPAFVKLCQWIATRRDIFPPNVCDRLAHLHDFGVCHDWYYTHQALVRSFGPNYTQFGLRVEHDINDKYVGVIGSGSAAQVYKGTIKRRKTRSVDDIDANCYEYYPVAIKVLHPDFERRVQHDLWFMQGIADMIHNNIPSDFVRMINLPRITENFGSILQLQSDLRREADNLFKFRKNFYHDPDVISDSSILFPKPVDGWISKEVLVEQLVENSVPISEYLVDINQTDGSYDGIITTAIRKELAVPLLNAFLKMVFIDNFVHCGTYNYFIFSPRINRT
jgi:ABC1 atypical kinase-like domain